MLKFEFKLTAALRLILFIHISNVWVHSEYELSIELKEIAGISESISIPFPQFEKQKQFKNLAEHLKSNVHGSAIVHDYKTAVSYRKTTMWDRLLRLLVIQPLIWCRIDERTYLSRL